MIAVAKSQLGYSESRTKETIYAAWASRSSLPWCSEFVAWSAYKAGIPSSIIPVGTTSGEYREFFAEQGRYYILNNGQNNSSCGCKKMSAKTISFSGIKPGDILLIESNGNYADGPDHTCMVVSKNYNTVTTIDGNSHDQVEYRIRRASQIHGVCRPLYNLTRVSLNAKAVSGKRVKLIWKKLSDVSGYQIYRSTQKNSGYRLIKTVGKSTNAYTDKQIVKNKGYYYRVRAYKVCNGKRVYGRLSTIKTVKAV
ncbi:MAG: CHAP domain-containing protein [Eubacteriales bacterium]|nr:CHAP domain-containing protein [Eubacteriales bacterium]